MWAVHDGRLKEKDVSKRATSRRCPLSWTVPHGTILAMRMHLVFCMLCETSCAIMKGFCHLQFCYFQQNADLIPQELGWQKSQQ